MQNIKELSLKKLALNIYLEMMLRFGAVFINTYMISAYDTKLLGALSGANQIFIITGTMLSFLSVGCSVLLSQALGANNKNLAIRAVHIAMIFNFLVGIICFLLAFFGAKVLLVMLNVPDEILPHSIIYLKAISFVILCDSFCMILSSTIRTYGKAKELMLISLAMNVICVFFNACFLYGFLGFAKLGLFGVGISSIIGRLFCMFGFLYIYLYKLKLKLYFALFYKIKLKILKKILKIGGFSAGEGFLWNAQYLVIFSIIANLGTLYLSAHVVFFQISIFIFSAGSAISVANEIIVGRLVGKKEPQKAYLQTFKALRYGLVFTIICLSLVFFTREYILDFVHFDDSLKSIIRPLFYVSIFLECSRTFNIVMVNALRASGDVGFPFYMGIIFMWGVSVPLAYILKDDYALTGVWLAFFADEFLRGMCNTFRWFSKKWQNKALV